MNEIQPILKLNIFDKFNCKADNCNISCCKGWSIVWSQEECNKIFSSSILNNKIPDIKNFFKESGKEYLREVVLDDNNFCPFLTEEGWCKIQRECDHSYLSYTCQSFPRERIEYNGCFEVTLSPACEKTLELLMEEKEGIYFDQNNASLQELAPSISENNRNYTKEMYEERPILNYLFDIKYLAVRILTDRIYSIEQRILILGMALQKIDEFEKGDNLSIIPEYIDLFLESMSNGKLKNQIILFKQNEKEKVQNNLIYMTLLMHDVEYAKKIMHEAKNNIGVEIENIEHKYPKDNDKDNKIIFKVPTNYNEEMYQKCKNIFDDIMLDKQHFIENVMILYFINMSMPFRDIKRSIYDNYFAYVLCFTTYALLLTTSMTEHFSEKNLIDLTVIHSRSTVHKAEMVRIVDEFRKNKNDITIEQMAGLLL